MMQSLCDTSPEVRQAAAYGVGVMAQFGGENYRPAFTGEVYVMTFPTLVTLVNDLSVLSVTHIYGHVY